MLMGAGIKWLLIGALSAGAAGFVVMQGAPGASAPGQRVAASGLPIETVTLGGKPLELEVAATPKAVERGLSKRTEVPDGTGMIFVFPESRILSFWMIDCLTDIDVAYLDRTGKVVSTYTMTVEPPQGAGESRDAYMNRLKRYPSADDAMFAIEVKAGLLEKLGIRAGSTVKVDYAKLRGHLRAR